MLAGAYALLLFSALEFTAVTILFTGAMAVTALTRGDVTLAELGLPGFYVLSFYSLAMVGIMARTRLKRSEREAREELERLNATLRSEVEAQVARIRRAETFSRYLPPELSEQVLASDTGDALAHGHRNVAVLCASPVGFLESLARLATDQVAALVNSFVSAMSRVAFDHGGVIERFVGPRLTVLFGSLAEQDVSESVKRAVAMAREMQRSCNVLLLQWEHEGLRIHLRMAIGITAGPSVVGTFGSERRVEYSALGEPMVRAHRLTATAIPGEIRLDAAAAEWMKDIEIGPGEAVEFAPGRPEATYVIDPHRGETLPVEPDGGSEGMALHAALMATSVARPADSLASGATLMSRGLTPPTPRHRQPSSGGGSSTAAIASRRRSGAAETPPSTARSTSRCTSRARSSCSIPNRWPVPAPWSSCGAKSTRLRGFIIQTSSSSTTSGAASRDTTI